MALTKNKTIWFTSQGNTIGVVMATNDQGEKKAYIGVAAGYNENDDENLILQYGAKIHASHADIILKHLS